MKVLCVNLVYAALTP
nr:hypothetical protein [Vibrio vulnificus]